MAFKDLKISEDTVIHCPTEELANKVLAIFDKCNLRWVTGRSFLCENYWCKHGKNTVYFPLNGQYESFNNAVFRNSNIISAEDFLKLHEEPINKRIYYKGDKERCKEIIKSLEDLGGINRMNFTGGDPYELYFIDPVSNYITCSYTYNTNVLRHLVETLYTETFLPEKEETIEIEGKKYNKSDVINRLKELEEII